MGNVPSKGLDPDRAHISEDLKNFNSYIKLDFKRGRVRGKAGEADRSHITRGLGVGPDRLTLFEGQLEGHAL